MIGAFFVGGGVKTTTCQREAFADAALVGLGVALYAPPAEQITALAKEVLLILGKN